MKYRIADVLSDGGNELIEKAVAEAESCTSGEVVVRLKQSVDTTAQTVREAAFEEFLRLGVKETRLRNGILLFIALDQQQVELIADEGIYKVVPQGTWQRVVDIITLGFRAGVPAHAIVMGVKLISDLLSSHFPPLPTDTNELSDRVHRDTDLGEE